MRGKNTENYTIGKYIKTTEYQRKRRIILKFMNIDKHVVFNDIANSRMKKEIHNEVGVIITIITIN